MEQEQPGVAAPVVPPVDAPPGRRKAAWIGMGALLVALVLLAFLSGPSGIDHDAPPPAADGSTPAADPEDGKSAGKPAPLQFTLKDMNGVDVSLASFKGKVILVNFWAKWCGPCRAEIPDLVELQTKYKDDLVILGILVQDRWDDKVAPFAAQLKINYPLLDASERTDVEEAFGPMWGLPTTFIVGRDGKIARKRTGIGSKEYFEQEIRALL